MIYDFIISGRWVYLVPVPVGDDLKILVDGLSYVRVGTRFLPNPSWGVVNLYDFKHNRFPIGLLNRVSSILPLIIKNNGLNVPNNVNYEDMRFYQKEALNQMFNNNCGIIKIPTGGGKTKIGIIYIKNTKKPTLILVPTLDLLKQWTEQIQNEYVHIKTYQSIKNKKYLQQFSTIIMDECHHAAAKTIYKIGININEKAKIFGFSGTPLNRKDDNLKVEAVLGHIIYEISTKELRDKKYICNAKIYFHKLKSFNLSKKYFKYSELYDEYIVNNSERNNKIIEIISSSRFPCLVLVNRINHGEILHNLVNNSVFLNGKMKVRNTNNVDVIIATNIFDEGIDLPEIKTLILCSGGNSNIKIIQRIGRGLRVKSDGSDLVVHDFVDDVKWFFKHFEERYRIFVSEGYDVVICDD